MRGCLWRNNSPSCDDTVTTAPFPLHAVRAKLLMLVAPFLRRWNYTRVLEQVCRGCNICCILSSVVSSLLLAQWRQHSERH